MVSTPNADADQAVTGTLPRSWENEETFHDVLYEWMNRAPWVALSGALHLVIALIVAAIPWNVFSPSEEQVIVCSIAQLSEEIPEELPEPPIEIPEDVETEPTLEPIEFMDVSDVSDMVSDDVEQGDESNAEAPFENPFDNTNSVLGVGPGGGGKFGNRFGDKGKGKRRGSVTTNRAVHAGLSWLAAHQDADGRWDSDNFAKHDPSNDRTTGAGDPNHDVGVTAFALLAFLGDGHTLTRGEFAPVVKRGVRWLLDAQDRESGLIGQELGHSYVYDHAIATIALAEACYGGTSITVKTRAQKAVDYITRFRKPYGVWRYQPPPSGDEDTSVTGWMIFALKAAEDAGLRVDVAAYQAAELWFDSMTDPGTGRVGYTEQGSVSSRVTGLNDHFPTEHGEALTAVTLLCRFFLGQTPETHPVMTQHADLLARTLPKWDPESFGCDMYYWYYGSYAMFQMGGRHWKQWNRAMKSAVVDSQRGDGASNGSWDPVGPWGHSGGRVYSTAAMVLCLEVYYRYARLASSR